MNPAASRDVAIEDVAALNKKQLNNANLIFINKSILLFNRIFCN